MTFLFQLGNLHVIGWVNRFCSPPIGEFISFSRYLGLCITLTVINLIQMHVLKLLKTESRFASHGKVSRLTIAFMTQYCFPVSTRLIKIHSSVKGQRKLRVISSDNNYELNWCSRSRIRFIYLRFFFFHTSLIREYLYMYVWLCFLKEYLLISLPTSPLSADIYVIHFLSIFSIIICQVLFF